MPKEKTPIRYYLAIAPQFTQDDTLIGYDIHSQNEGMPEEVVMTVLRNWLQMLETNYHDRFRAAHISFNLDAQAIRNSKHFISI